jgi:2-amino-4-hydroxy-6-hydroxymethyldihydropteridine diphosphokinase
LRKEKGNMTVRAFLGLGSNMGDRWQYLRNAAAGLPDLIRISPVYETDPLGPPGQGPYLNCVVELSTDRSPRQLLSTARAAEEAAGRVRTVRWGPRTLDVDVLIVGDEFVNDADLTVPHPRLWDRPFVVIPLADLAPDLVGDRRPDPVASGVRFAGIL